MEVQTIRKRKGYYKRLRAADERALWRLKWRGGPWGPLCTNEIVRRYLPRTGSVWAAYRVRGGDPGGVSPGADYAESLRSAAFAGLLDAVERFRRKEGVQFFTYAVHRIRGAILDELRKMRATSSAFRQQNAYIAEKLGYSLESSAGIRGTAAALGFGENAFRASIFIRRTEEELRSPSVSLDAPLPNGDQVHELVADREQLDTFGVVAQREATREFSAALATLPPVERSTLVAVALDGRSRKDVARRRQVPIFRVGEEYLRAIKRLRHYYEAQGMRSAADALEGLL